MTNLDGAVNGSELVMELADNLGGGNLASSPGKMLVKDQYDPYAPIRKDASKTSAGNITGYGIELEVQSEKGPQWELAGTVSPEYLLVPNQDIKRIGDDIVSASGLDWKEDRVIFDGRRYARTLVVETEEFHQELNVGDVYRFGLLQRNSYDGSIAASVSLFIERLVCSNGMVSSQYFAHHKFKHTLGNENWEEEMERALSIVKHAPATLTKFIGAMETLQSQKMDDNLLRQVRKGLIPNLPVTKWGEIMDRYLGHEEATVYGLLNAATRVLWHKSGSAMVNLSQNDYVVSNLLDWAYHSQN